jgi:hypothetical protein
MGFVLIYFSDRENHKKEREDDSISNEYLKKVYKPNSSTGGAKPFKKILFI